jgi:hypothetical protein
MAKIDMNEIKKDTINSAEIEKSNDPKQAETDTKIDESTDNALKTAEDNSETATKTEDETNKTEFDGKVVVTYVGGGIWKDSEGKLWASTKKSDNILNERQYTAEEYKNREDIKFMVSYGAMKATHVK